MSNDEKIIKAIKMALANLKIEDDFLVEKESELIENTKNKIKQKIKEVQNGRSME